MTSQILKHAEQLQLPLTFISTVGVLNPLGSGLSCPGSGQKVSDGTFPGLSRVVTA